MAKILVVDDERFIRNSLKEALEYEDYEVDTVESGSRGLEMIEKSKYDLVICDIKMEGMDGIEFLDRVMADESQQSFPTIMISGHGNIDIAVDCIKKGAFDFIEKPFDLNRILMTVRNALDRKESVKEAKIGIKQKNLSGKNQDIVGESEPIMNVKRMIAKVAPSEARVLITGSNGTGKELVARQLHKLSHRNTGPFIEVNCAAIPADLIESEMFGHEKGAFTSAVKQRRGKFEQADGGTLFLDEIGDMSLSAQAKVLRALQEGKISRVGGDKDIPVNVRVLAATNKNLAKEIEKGNFREDLFHRLSVVIIHVPSLAERKEDIPILIRYFLEDACKREGSPVRKIEDKAMEMLKELPWRGNIRELLNVVERLVVFTHDDSRNDESIVITAKDVQEYVIDADQYS